jgi:hypothetical protein
METIVFEIIGTSALLQNNPASMQGGGGAAKGLNVKRIPDPAAEAAAKVYLDGKGVVYIPAIAFRSALLGACTGKRIGKMGAKSCVSAGVFNAETACPLFDPETRKPIKEYAVHTTRAVVQGQAVMRSRPMVEKWATRVAFEVDTDFVTAAQVRELMGLAGRSQGVGDWRPAKRGPFGRFTVKA